MGRRWEQMSNKRDREAGGGGDDDDWGDFAQPTTLDDGDVIEGVIEGDNEDGEAVQSTKKKKKKRPKKASTGPMKWMDDARPLIQLGTASEQMELFNAAAKEMGEEALFDESMFVGSGIMIEEQGKPREDRNYQWAIKELVKNWHVTLKDPKKKQEGRKPVKPGMRVLVVGEGAVRCIDIIKWLKEFKPPIAKLFAKHMKLKEQIAFLKGSGPTNLDWSDSRLAVGTAGRYVGAAEAGALDCSQLQLVVLDMQRDVKNRDLFTNKDSRESTIKLLQKFVLPNMETPAIFLF